MAVLRNAVQFTGSLGDITAFKLPGSSKIYLRTKGGHSKERQKTDPSFELSQKNASEFGGCSKAAALFRQAVLPVAHLKTKGASINTTVMKIIKIMQKSDSTGQRGQRAIRFSEHKQFLNRFNLSRNYSAESQFLSLFKGSIERGTGTAKVVFPDCQEDFLLYFPWKQPMYRFILHLGILPDLECHNQQYNAPPRMDLPYAQTVYTNWRYTHDIYTQEDITLPLKNSSLLQDNMTMVLSAGIEMGIRISDTTVATASNGGCATVLLAG